MHACLARPMKRALQVANSTASAYATTIVPQFARPTGDGVIDLSQDGGGMVPHAVKVLGIGVGTATNTMKIRVYGWNQVLSQGTAQPPGSMWVPQLLSDATYTLGSAAGVTNGVVPATELFATTIALVSDPTQVNVASTYGHTIYQNPAATSLIGLLIVEIFGHQILQFDFSTNSSATSTNALYSLL